MNAALHAHLLKRFELYVALLAVAFISATCWLVLAEARSVVIFGVTAGGMTMIQGAIQWADRERQQRLRAQAIAEIREMLTDQVLNQLAGIKMWMRESLDPAAIDLIIQETDASIGRVATMINGLSEEQLNTWKLTYANVADQVLFPPPALA